MLVCQQFFLQNVKRYPNWLYLNANVGNLPTVSIFLICYYDRKMVASMEIISDLQVKVFKRHLWSTLIGLWQIMILFECGSGLESTSSRDQLVLLLVIFL